MTESSTGSTSFQQNAHGSFAAAGAGVVGVQGVHQSQGISESSASDIAVTKRGLLPFGAHANRLSRLRARGSCTRGVLLIHGHTLNRIVDHGSTEQSTSFG